MITRHIKTSILTKQILCNYQLNLIVENVIQVKSGKNNVIVNQTLCTSEKDYA